MKRCETQTRSTAAMTSSRMSAKPREKSSMGTGANETGAEEAGDGESFRHVIMLQVRGGQLDCVSKAVKRWLGHESIGMPAA